ncbi:hypothetical protein UPYG_G00048990 [Umbra pygmaea]|uniref:Regulator of G-protein signaling 12 n=1 Tax=Umbra pygmaea TaxID=75934 RepID=A0ABD0XU60_UMBPY
MFRQTDTSSKRHHGGGLTTLPSPPPTQLQQGGRLRGVEVARGRAGYGFTLSGQGPCVLSCILKGSPADYVGLRSGDHILSVNDINVSKASHEDVVKLIGRCTGVLRLVVAEGDRGGRRHVHSANRNRRHGHNAGSPAGATAAAESCSSDEELEGFHNGGGNNNNNVKAGPRGNSASGGGGPGWFKPKLDSKTLGINRAERVVAEMQSGGIFSMIFDNSSHSSSSSEKDRVIAPPPRTSSSSSSMSAKPARPLSEPEFPAYRTGRCQSRSNPNLLSEEEMDRVLMNDDSVFLDSFHQQDAEGQVEGEDLGLEPSEGILNVGMMVGYLGSIELASTGASLESDSLQAIRGSMRRLRAEQKIHSLVLMKVMHDSVRLCSDRGQVLATYPAGKLAFSACCPDDRRFFGLVTMQATRDDDGHYGNSNREDDGGLRTSCHVFIVDPELCHHQVHVGVARRFGFECTPDPETGGCMEFPPTSQPLLQFVSVLYRDMGENIEGVRARAFIEPDNDPQQNHSTSSNSDSGIGNFLPEEKNNRVLLVDLGNQTHNPGPRHWDSPPPPSANAGPPHPPPQHRSGYRQSPAQHQQSQRWLPVHVLRDWRQPDKACGGHTQGQPLGPGLCSDQESYAESTDGWSSANCSTLPPPMSKIPADRYRAPLPAAEIPLAPQPARQTRQRDEWAKKLFGPGERAGGKAPGNRKDGEKKAGRFRGLTVGLPPLTHRSSGRRSFGRSKRISLARSLDDLEAAVLSDGELNSGDRQGCGSDNSLNSNASLPSVQCHRRHAERRVASWAVCFERLLQDPIGVRYFSEFLKKEFSEENILFWQACEFFSHVPDNDKKQLTQRARDIYSSYLSSKATTPVNIDSQAQLADDILNAPRPDMFKEQQLQIFNLMKFDSYTRFLKSLLYQECMLAEVEGRPLPDPHHVPSSPTSKHSTSSDRSNLSTPKKEDKKTKSGRSLNEEKEKEDPGGDKKKSTLFSWSRNRSFGKGPKKRDLADINYNIPGNNGRRESQGSLSSGASVELGTPGSGKNEGCSVDRERGHERDREPGGGVALRQCNINLPDGTCCSVPVRAGASIREVLLGLCEKLCINLAAVDLFLVGGEKPLVLDQDCMTLCSRDLRLEKRTLFRLDLVPINRSVGLKAKPTKPVTEVLRPVVAKYGLHLSDLVARISGEKELLDLGLPISNLDGLRVVLDVADNTAGKDKQNGASSKTHALPPTTRNQTATGGERASGKPNGNKPTSAHDSTHDDRLLPSTHRDAAVPDKAPPLEKRKQKKINIEEAEEFFELISKAQSKRADDQRGLLDKTDLELPDFLRVQSSPTPAPPPACSTPRGHKGGYYDDGDDSGRRGNRENGRCGPAPPDTGHQSQHSDSVLRTGGGGRRALLPPTHKKRPPPPFPGTLSPPPGPHHPGLQELSGDDGGGPV